MQSYFHSMNIDDLIRAIGELSREIAAMRERGPASFQDVQRVGNALTRAQLVLNDLERVCTARAGGRYGTGGAVRRPGKRNPVAAG